MKSLRLLPLTVVLAFGLIGKVVVFGDHLLSGRPTAPLGIPIAEAKESSEAAHGRDNDNTTTSAGNAAAASSGKAGRKETTCPPPPPPPEPTGPTFSDAELAVLQQLTERRDALDKRESDLQGRETVLAATQSRIDEKVASLKQLQTTLEGLIHQHNAEQEAKLRSLVKIYETMKPADAARIVEQLDFDTLLPVADLMKERSLAAILANLSPTKARDLTVELKKRREVAQPAQLQ